MDDNLPNDATIRAYLLGQMESDVLIQRIDELMLSNEEFSEYIDVIEDEIIEEYVEGTLSAADRKAVENHFLRPQERQRKLEESRLLSRCFSGAARNSLSQVQKATRESQTPLSMLSQSRFRFGMYVGIAAMALLTLWAGYLFRSRHQLQADVLRSNQNLVQERERALSLSQQLQGTRVGAPAPNVLLSLVQPGVRRSDETLPALRIAASTKNIHVEIALPSDWGGKYDVRLETRERIVWHRDKIQALSSPDGAVLMFDVPAQVLSGGESRFVIRRKSEIENSYWFTTSKE